MHLVLPVAGQPIRGVPASCPLLSRLMTGTCERTASYTGNHHGVKPYFSLDTHFNERMVVPHI
jgi:hypothetical protein